MSNLFSRVSASDRPSVPHLRSMVIAAVAVLVIFGGLYVWRATKSAAAPREAPPAVAVIATIVKPTDVRSEEHTSELQSLMRISYAVFCLKTKKTHYKAHIQPKKIL